MLFDTCILFFNLPKMNSISPETAGIFNQKPMVHLPIMLDPSECQLFGLPQDTIVSGLVQKTGRQLEDIEMIEMLRVSLESPHPLARAR